MVEYFEIDDDYGTDECNFYVPLTIWVATLGVYLFYNFIQYNDNFILHTEL